jgi:hypothetical protein
MSSTETSTTAKAVQVAKLSLGVPSQHKPVTEPDQEELTGTVEYAPVLFPDYLPVWESPQAK